MTHLGKTATNGKVQADTQAKENQTLAPDPAIQKIHGCLHAYSSDSLGKPRLQRCCNRDVAISPVTFAQIVCLLGEAETLLKHACAEQHLGYINHYL